ncbi:MAG TPA: nitroreductase family protein [Verrucomicrobiales bacterium]|nr:nitroreductase family protein [Verrucomicrobiales bacterium]
MHAATTIPLPGFVHRDPDEMLLRATTFRDEVRHRRTVRHFSKKPVARSVIEVCIAAAGSAPSGANLQPWRFIAISSAAVKREIRTAAEAEEREFYEHRAPDGWLDLLAPLGTDASKAFLEDASWLIAIFALRKVQLADGRVTRTYYPLESVGIATGILITALHHTGLATLTHTPSPMKFLNGILDRPSNEKPFLLLVVGHPAEGVRVPDIHRRPLEEIACFL